ncbi:hypothetical protein B566_EDAN017545 [Ephemera danica]|nr:hypothetical protein B566_EDAN017545 [Ephemera danica]
MFIVTIIISALHKTIILKKDPRFCAEGVLDIIPPQMEIKPPIPVLDNDNKIEPTLPSSPTRKEENTEDAKATAKKSLSSKAKTNPRSRRKAGSSQKMSSRKNGSSSNSTTPVAKSAGVLRTANRRRKLNGASSVQASPEPLPGDDVEPADPPAEESSITMQQAETELDPSIIRTGQPVFAKWTDELYYSGKVGQEQKGKWDIYFDDGAKRQVFEENIMFVDRLPLGQPVFARYQTNSQNFYPGIIYSYTEGPPELLYQVDLDNEGQHDVPRSQLCMSQEQVNILRGDTAHNQSITTPTHRHDVSLDNMLDGKRIRGKKLQMGSPIVSHSSGRTRSATSGLESKPGCSRSLAHRSNSADLLEASSDSQADAHVLWKSDWDNIPGAEEAAYYPPPVPSKISFSKNKSNNGQGSESQSESQDADSDRDDGLDFNWRHLEQQLSKGGGEVVNFFEDHHLKRGSDKCFMITNRSSTSTKSIMCLALGVRSVRFMWIIQSCVEGKLLPYKSYLLPAGQSLYPIARIEWSSRPDKARPFNNMTIALVSNVENSNFLEFWKKVLLLGKASRVLSFLREDFVTQEKNDLKGLVDIIVTDNDHTEQLVDMANALRLPLVRTNWAIQCLIRGEFQDTFMHLLNNLENKNLSEITRRFSASQEV